VRKPKDANNILVVRCGGGVFDSISSDATDVETILYNSMVEEVMRFLRLTTAGEAVLVALNEVEGVGPITHEQHQTIRSKVFFRGSGELRYVMVDQSVDEIIQMINDQTVRNIAGAGSFLISEVS